MTIIANYAAGSLPTMQEMINLYLYGQKNKPSDLLNTSTWEVNKTMGNNDFDGDGVETVGEGAGIFFDHNGDGIKKVGGWVKDDDGFLVFDRNGDKVINDGSELFGDNTVRYDGSGTCLNAFEALAAMTVCMAAKATTKFLEN